MAKLSNKKTEKFFVYEEKKFGRIDSSHLESLFFFYRSVTTTWPAPLQSLPAITPPTCARPIRSESIKSNKFKKFVYIIT